MNQFKGGFILPFPNHAKIFDFRCIETKFRVNHFENNWNRISLFLKNSFYNFLFYNLSSKNDYKLPTEEYAPDSMSYNTQVQAAEIEITANSTMEAHVRETLPNDGLILNFKAFKLKRVVLLG
jgi:hypothetical protein